MDVTNSIERMEKRLPTITDKLDDIDGRLPLLRDGTHKHGEVVKVYFDWEMIVEKMFHSHVVPEVYRVRQATSEFKDFAIIWWNGLGETENGFQSRIGG
uniref:Uncharacterized protein n=1 Tax=Oryza meridionalis TaxID=40149 RepID=A0A0E0F3C2_9ORYZ